MNQREKFEAWAGAQARLNNNACAFEPDCWEAWKEARKQALQEAMEECSQNARFWREQQEADDQILTAGKALGASMCVDDIAGFLDKNAGD